MDWWNRPVGCRMAPFEANGKSVLKHSMMLSNVWDGYRYFQTPPIVVGGFVGSKICEQKNGSTSCSDALDRIIDILTKPVAKPVQQQHPVHLRVPRYPCEKTVSPSRTYSQATMTTQSSAQIVVVSGPQVIPPIVMEPVVVNSVPSPAPSAPHPTTDTVDRSSTVQRTVSESSDTSWGSVDPADSNNLIPVSSSNPWLSNMIVCVTDGSHNDTDDDSEWDCVDDFQSENGEILSGFQWHQGDCLSPIASPTSRTPPAAVNATDINRDIYNCYDSDEEEGGFYISCEPYQIDTEEEARERHASEERLRAVNIRWEQGLADDVTPSSSSDRTDGISQKSTRRKQVHFASKLVHVRPMLTWSHAHKLARKGDWERLARDSERFRERIEAASAVLSPILEPSHRERIRQQIATMELNEK